MTTDNESKATGIRFGKREPQIRPPFEGRDEEEGLREPMPPRDEVGAEERVMGAGKVPLHPAAVMLPASILGRVGTELTGYPGFTFTEQELNWLAELWIQCGIMMSPVLQASISTTAMVGGKFGGYYAWVKQGKPKVAGAEAIGKETVEEEEESE